MSTPLRPIDRPSVLTLRQRQIVMCIGRQMQTRDIAVALGIATATVNKHRNHITQRLRLSNTAQLTAYCVHAVQHGGLDAATAPTLYTMVDNAPHAAGPSGTIDIDALASAPTVPSAPPSFSASAAYDAFAYPPRLGLREWQILQLLANGMTSKEMARHLSLSPRTISEHRRRLMRRFSVHRMVELMTLYTRIAAMHTV